MNGLTEFTHCFSGTPVSLEHVATAMCHHCGWLHRENRELKQENHELRAALSKLVWTISTAFPEGLAELDEPELQRILDAAITAGLYLNGQR